jgi:hypothetical protein
MITKASAATTANKMISHTDTPRPYRGSSACRGLRRSRQGGDLAIEDGGSALGTIDRDHEGEAPRVA